MSSVPTALIPQSATLAVAKGLSVASIGLFAGVAMSFNAVIMPSLRKISQGLALPIWV
ncbi:hypothetical protein BGZ73_009075, partial [Actinomortierella ambigua]